MAPRRQVCPLALLLPLAFALLAMAMAKPTGQVTVFCGRNANEDTLREACDTGLYTMVIISFYSIFGHGRYWGDLSGHRLTTVGTDIKHCQSKNFLALLSIGGNATNSDYSLPTSYF
ncbi:unnamed protein product [Urochloa humidicola]